MDPKIVTSVTGEAREATYFYGDGSYNCPFCTYAIGPNETVCHNPWCEATPGVKLEWVLERKAKEEEEHKRMEFEQRRQEAHRQYYEEGKRIKAEFRAQKRIEAIAGGYCLNCLFDKYDRVKFIKHRKPCPNAR